jgi:hypothetical protein
MNYQKINNATNKNTTDTDNDITDLNNNEEDTKSESEYVDKIKKDIIDFFWPEWIKISKETHNYNMSLWPDKLITYVNNVLQDNNAFIGGDFILKSFDAIINKDLMNIDIYVSKDNEKNVRQLMTKLFNYNKLTKETLTEDTIEYYKINGIHSIKKYIKTLKSGKVKQMNIIIADKTPIDIIKNADLSFCQNWYDGKNLHILHPEDLFKKSGILQDLYLDALYKGNIFLVNHMKKYIDYDFRISINESDTKKIINITYGINKLSVNNTKEIINYRNLLIESENYVSLSNPILEEISEQVIQKPVTNTSLKMPINTNKILNMSNIITNNKINKYKLSKIEAECIKYYTYRGDRSVNEFLHSDKVNYHIYTPIILYLKAKFLKSVLNKNIEYDNKLLYYYFVNLYNTILYNGVKSDIPFNVFRGVKTWYLETNTDKFYYLNSFSSTSLTSKIASEFSGKLLPGSTEKYKVYIFYVHPLCQIMNITDLSVFRGEQELLLNPYHRYLYIDQVNTDIHEYRKYIILPTDLNIPTTFKGFMSWKDNIAKLSSNNLIGGKVPHTITNNFIKVNTTKVNTIKNINNKRIKLNKTIKKIKSERVEYNDDIIHRFTDPIPSFPGKAPTEKEKEVINQMIKFLKYK